MESAIDDFLVGLERDLDRLADPATKQWWENYLKGAIGFRGVRMAGIRATVQSLWGAQHLGSLAPNSQIDLALACLARELAEDKLAGVLILGEQIPNRLRLEHVPLLARPLQLGHIADWNTCDWYCVKAIGPLVARSIEPRPMAEAVAEWRYGRNEWHRRAAAVSLVGLAPIAASLYEGFDRLLIEVAEAGVASTERFVQTSVGWLLRELSISRPDLVVAFLDEYERHLSPEALKSATAKLPPAGVT